MKKSPRINKSSFIRSMGDKPAKAVVAAAAAKGMKLSEKYVYNIRAKTKADGGKVPGRIGRPPGRPKAAKNGLDSERSQLTDLVLSMGFAEVDRHIAGLKSRAKSFLLAG
jgi:hypothetical protein